MLQQTALDQLEELEEQITQLPPEAQFKLATRIMQRLSLTVSSAEDIRQMRQERDKQVTPVASPVVDEQKELEQAKKPVLKRLMNGMLN